MEETVEIPNFSQAETDGLRFISNTVIATIKKEIELKLVKTQSFSNLDGVPVQSFKIVITNVGNVATPNPTNFIDDLELIYSFIPASFKVNAVTEVAIVTGQLITFNLGALPPNAIRTVTFDCNVL